MALEHVAHGQSRFLTPGLTPDARGIVLGKFCYLAFASLDGVVSWLRLYGAEASLDELLGHLLIQRVQTALGSREVMLRIPAISSHTADRAARLGRMLGAQIYTGSSKHYVKYRDERSPYGYDLGELLPSPPNTDLTLYGEAYAQSYQVLNEIPFARLLFRLSLRRVPGGDRLTEADREEVLLVVERGIAEGLVRYFWRNRVAARAGWFTPQNESAFTERRRGYMLFSVRHLPERMASLFLGMPGIALFRPRGPAAAVALGFVHPIDLASCASVFPTGTFHLFWEQDRVDVLAGPLELSDIVNLTQLDLAVENAAMTSQFDAEQQATIAVNFALVPGFAPPTRVTATLVPLTQGPWLRRLLFAMPPAMLRGQRIAVTDHGIVIVAETTSGTGQAAQATTQLVPLGQPLRSVVPGLFVPATMDIVPRVAPDVLARAVGHAATHVTVLQAGAGHFRVATTALRQLDRAAIAAFVPEDAVVQQVAATQLPAPIVYNEDVGRFALWGFPEPPERVALGSGDKE